MIREDFYPMIHPPDTLTYGSMDVDFSLQETTVSFVVLRLLYGVLLQQFEE